MVERDLIITKAEALGLCNSNIPTKEVHINSVNDCGYKYMDIFCIVEDKNTKEEFKMKIRIEGQQTMILSYLTDEEYNEAIG